MTTATVVLVLIFGVTLTLADYWTERTNLIKSDRKHAVGSSIRLNRNEQNVNKILMGYKSKEYDDGFANPQTFLAAQHFFKSKKEIEASKVFSIIQRMPKGGSLHSHDVALVSDEYLFSLTYRDNLYGCVIDGELKLRFFDEHNVNNVCNWTTVKHLRQLDKNFDNLIKSKLSLTCNNPEQSYPTLNSVWKAFQKIFVSICEFVTYKPIWEEYFYEALKELYDDNVKYLEFRGLLPEVYDLDGRIYDAVEIVGMYYGTLKKFMKDYPDFYGAKFIYAPSRKVGNDTMRQYVNTFWKLSETYPDFVAGFDLVGQEDTGEPLESFITELIELKNRGKKLFFHAGETNWNGESADMNLFDAVLLNTSRIGHGYALLKHPALLDRVKEREIAIEICPISNQVLKLVVDIRNHPGAYFIANNFPVVVAPDDPSIWGAKGLSYDWYIVFMGMASKEDDLRLLKQLAINSIIYSSMGNLEKIEALNLWKDDWDKFIDEVLKEGNMIANVNVD